MITVSRNRQTSHGARWSMPILAALFTLTASVARAEPAQLHVISQPSGATLSIDGTPAGTCPQTLLSLPTGKHLIQIEKRDYTPIKETLTLSDGERVTREYNLQPILGLVLVHSIPSGAEIEINGTHRGTTPALIADLKLGTYRARLLKPGYIDKEIEMAITSRNPKKFDVTLVSDSASIQLTSEPVGADVTLNGVSRGKTPCALDRVPSGSTTLELALKGFEPYSQNLKLTAGEHEEITAVLKPIPSDLELVSIPAGARIYVGNQFRGTAPVKLKAIQPGTYRIRAEMDAYDVMPRNVTIGRAQNIVEEFRLQANAGALEITTEPSEVAVLLDGKEVGTTEADTNRTDRVSDRFSIKLIPSGTHTLTLTKVGFYEHKQLIEINRDEVITRHFRLKRRFIPNYEVKTESEVYRGILIEVDSQKNIKLEIHPGIFKTLSRSDVRSAKPLREDQLQEDL